MSLRTARSEMQVRTSSMAVPGRSRLGVLSDEERQAIRATSPVGTGYDRTLDRDSAEEVLARRAAQAAEAAAKDSGPAASRGVGKGPRTPRGSVRDQPFHAEVARQLGRSVQRQIVNRVAGQLVRGLLGGLFRGR